MCQSYGVNYASCGTELAQSSTRTSLSGAACLALVRVSALYIRRYPSRESRPGLALAGGDGNGAPLVSDGVAPPPWHRCPLRRAEYPYRASAKITLPAPSLPPSGLGRHPTPPRARHPTAAR